MAFRSCRSSIIFLFFYLLLTPTCQAESVFPNRFEWQIEGTIHQLPVSCYATVREDWFWSMDCDHNPPPGEEKKMLKLTISGSFEELSNGDLEFTSDYGKADVIVTPKGNNTFSIKSKNVDIDFQSIKLPMDFIKYHEKQKNEHPYYKRLSEEQKVDKVLEKAIE